MQIMKQSIGKLLIYAKRKARFLKRTRSSKLYPLHITKQALAECEEYYDTLVDHMLDEMKRYRQVNKADYEGRFLFENYEILSFNGDRMGKVFRKNGEIYRGIYKESCIVFKELWETGLLQVLSLNGFIPQTEITGYYTSEYPIILKHQQVQIVASKLWNTEMIKDAAILISLIKCLSEKVGFTLHDGHMNNVTFHEGTPVFTDIGSFVKNIGQKTVCNKEILFSGCYRCIFRQLNNNILSRIQPYDEQNNAIWLEPRFYDDLTREYYSALKKYMAYHRYHSSLVSRAVLHRMFYFYDVKPAYIDLVFSQKSRDNFKKEVPDAVKIDIDHVADALLELQWSFSSVADLSNSRGMLGGRLFTRFKIPVTSIEYSDDASNAAYIFYKNEYIRGNTLEFHYLYGCDPAARKAVQADLVIVLDITHNVISYQQYRMDSLFNSVRKMTNHYVLVTYYPNRGIPDQYIPMSNEERIEEVKMCFEQFFDLIAIKEISAGAAKEENGFWLSGVLKK